jgi:NADP-dependent 3-hydroxy acid dehydrogenase YdfG
VSQINPGLVDTEFSEVRFKGDKQRSKSVYNGMTPLTGDDIADLILFVVTRPAHVNISDSIIFPAAQASSTLVKRDQS